MPDSPPALALALRRLRRTRAWSQAHLAGAAGLSLRTVQRAERGAPVAPETRLALAAAFDVDVAALTDPVAAPDDALVARRIGPRLRPAQALAVGAALAAPAVLFVAAALAQALFGIDAPMRPVEALLASPVTRGPFNAVSPAVFVGGLVGAAVLNLAPAVGLRVGTGAVEGAVAVRARVANLALAAVAFGTLAVLLAYAVGENLMLRP